MMLQNLQDIVQDVQCGVGNTCWTCVSGVMGQGYYIQLRYIEPDIETGNLEDQHGRKWYVSPFSTKSEVVQTILKACLTSAEHMIREHFTYKGVRVFSPHFDVEQLVALATKGQESREVREPKSIGLDYGHGPL